MCFVLYTAMASYTAMMISKIITGNMPKDMPSIAVMPTASISPIMFMTYHSPLLTRANRRTADIAMAKMRMPIRRNQARC